MHPSQHRAGPVEALSSLWRHRSLIWQMTVREVVGRYRGSVMGLLWSFFNPVLMLAVYTFVFSGVFKARWPGRSSGHGEFAVIAFCGIIIHALFAECVNRAPGLILTNVNYVKKVVFPLEILPWVAIGSALFNAAVSAVVLLVFFAFIHHYIHWTVLFLPVVVLPLVLFTMGVSWWLAATGVYLRDVSQTTGIVVAAMMFMSPIFYPATSLPVPYRNYLLLNPLTFIIEQAQNVVLWGRLPEWGGLAIYLMVSLGVAWAGLFWFQKTRRGFADVL